MTVPSDDAAMVLTTIEVDHIVPEWEVPMFFEVERTGEVLEVIDIDRERLEMKVIRNGTVDHRA